MELDVPERRRPDEAETRRRLSAIRALRDKLAVGTLTPEERERLIALIGAQVFGRR